MPKSNKGTFALQFLFHQQPHLAYSRCAWRSPSCAVLALMWGAHIQYCCPAAMSWLALSGDISDAAWDWQTLHGINKMSFLQARVWVVHVTDQIVEASQSSM